MPTHDDVPAELAPGRLGYLQIPALDFAASADFYEQVFGWQVGRDNPGFEAPGLIGQFVDDRPSAGAAGLVPWLNVDHIDHALDLVRTAGGEVLDLPSPDGDAEAPDRWLATVRDPAGNVVGIVQHGPRS